MMSQADNYLLDAPLAAACHDDVVAHCSDVQPGQGRVHECLRAIPNALSPACKEAELSAEAREAEDIRLKPQLLEACQASGAQLCADVEPGARAPPRVPPEQGGGPGHGPDVRQEAHPARGAPEQAHADECPRANRV